MRIQSLVSRLSRVYFSRVCVHRCLCSSIEDSVSSHYDSGGLWQRIVEAVTASRSNINDSSQLTDPDHEDQIPAEDFHPVDQFHVGGVAATDRLLNVMGVKDGWKVLDIGCGLGGTTRRIKHLFPSCDVTGIDITPEFIKIAARISDIVGSEVRYDVGSAVDIPFRDELYDAACMLHVGMNISEKDKIYREAYRVLKSGGIFAVYDITLVPTGRITYPVPWAASPAHSFVSHYSEYISAAEESGFNNINTTDRGKEGMEFFDPLRKRLTAGRGMPPLSLAVTLGSDAEQKMKNVIELLHTNQITLTEIICTKL